MLKRFFENKQTDEPSNAAQSRGIEIAGEIVGIDQLHRMRQKLLEEIAHEQDPETISKASIVLAQINSGIQSLAAVDAASLEVDAARQAASEKEFEAADMGRKRFLQNIRDISVPALERLADIKHPGSADRDVELDYIKTRNAYIKKLDATLSYDAAEQQAEELRIAAHDRREWVDVVHLPKPDTVAEKSDLTGLLKGFSNKFEKLYGN